MSTVRKRGCNYYMYYIISALIMNDKYRINQAFKINLLVPRPQLSSSTAIALRGIKYRPDLCPFFVPHLLGQDCTVAL